MKVNIFILSFLVILFFVPQQNLEAQEIIKLQHHNRNISIQKQQKEKLAQYYYLNRQYDKAALLFKELYIKKPNFYFYSYYLNSLVLSNKFDEAIKLTRRQSKKHPANYRYKVDYIYVLEQSGDKKKADKLLRKILNKIPDNRSAVIQIANALQSKGYAQQAIEVYEKATRKAHNNYSYNLERANAYRLTGDYNKMFDAYFAYLNNHPKAVQLIKNRLQSTLAYDVDNNLKTLLRQKLLVKVQQNPDNFSYNDLLLWLSMQTGDFETAFRQARAIDRRFGNSEDEVYHLAKIAYTDKKYKIASEAFLYLKKKGKESVYYTDSYAGWLLTQITIAKNNSLTTKKKFSELDKEGEKFLKELNINDKTEKTALQLAQIKAFYLDNPAGAQKLLQNVITIPNLQPTEKAKAKLLLGDVLLFEKKIWDASLYYSQVELEFKNEPLGHEAKFKNAILFYYVGEFKWALARLDILKAATSKLISNDAIEMSMFIHDVLEEDTLGFTLRKFAAADLFVSQHNPDSAIFWLKNIEKNPPGPVSIQFALFKEAQIFQQQKYYKKADSVFTKLTKLYPESIKADDALFAAANLEKNYLGKIGEAAKMYLKLMKQYPESVFASQARQRYRNMMENKAEEKNGTP